jgi:pimeloyl-ACP methyl ester carboxylesterase
VTARAGLLCLALLCVLIAALASPGLAPPAVAAGTRRLTIHFPGPDGVRDSAVVALPSWYGPHDHPRLPLVISPHSRGITPWQQSRRWGDLPGRFRLIVVDPGLHGRIIPRRSWAWPPDIARMADLPTIVRRRIPYLRYDPDRVYAAGDSMGGQETLMLVARRPDVFAAAVAADPVTNFLRRWYEFPVSRESWREQSAATREVGATPRRARWLYVRRSPLFFARTFADSGVPLQLWWNPHDTVVIREGQAQAGVFYRAIERLNPHAPVVARLDHVMHGWVFKYDHELPAMVKFLLAHRRHPPPPGGFAYSSWRSEASIWRWHIRYVGPGTRLWSIFDVNSRGLRTVAPGSLTIRPPTPVASALVDGRSAEVGASGIRVPPGRHRLLLRYRATSPLPRHRKPTPRPGAQPEPD